MFFARFKINRLIKQLKTMQQSRIHNQPSEQALTKEIDGYYKLAEIYQSLQGKKTFPFAHELSLECYRAAAAIEDSTAQYLLGKSLLDEAKMREELQQQGLLASPSNARQLSELYVEAHAYLLAAENLKHVEAQRLRGLCYINGWGVEADKKKGFELIVASIEQENSWDRVPQIFEEMGLNKPEFFSALTQHRNKAG